MWALAKVRNYLDQFGLRFGSLVLWSKKLEVSEMRLVLNVGILHGGKVVASDSGAIERRFESRLMWFVPGKQTRRDLGA
jgi:hypothetical protein